MLELDGLNLTLKEYYRKERRNDRYKKKYWSVDNFEVSNYNKNRMRVLTDVYNEPFDSVLGRLLDYIYNHDNYWESDGL